jgi:hypothetical protein
MPLALAGSLTAVQFCYPAELSLDLNKIERFSKVSCWIGGWLSNPDDRRLMKFLIIGGDAAGMSAASKAKRNMMLP